MKLQFDKKTGRGLQVFAGDVKDQEQTLEIRLPESMPDMGNILAVWGEPVLCSKEWRGSGMRASGGVMVWMLYRPENGSAPESVEGWLPFDAGWDFPKADQEGTMRVRCVLKNVDARMLSAQKALIRCRISVRAEAFTDREWTWYSCPEDAKGAEFLRRSYPVNLPVEAGEKAFPVEETLNLPASCPPIQKILRCDLQPEIQEWKIMTGRLVFRGTAGLHLLYRSEDDQIQCWDFEVPFSQFADLKESYEENASAEICLQLTGMEVSLNADGQPELKSSLVAQYVIFHTEPVEVVQDGYCLNRTMNLENGSLELSEILEQNSSTVMAQQQIPIDGNRIVDVSFRPGGCSQMKTGEALTLEYTGQFQLLYYDREGNLCACQTGAYGSGRCCPAVAGAYGSGCRFLYLVRVYTYTRARGVHPVKLYKPWPPVLCKT